MIVDFVLLATVAFVYVRRWLGVNVYSVVVMSSKLFGFSFVAQL